MARAAADAWLHEVAATNRSQRPHFVALSGGRGARLFFEAAAGQARAGAISLSLVHFFWADERCVPPDDPESNFRLANELLLSPLAVNPQQVHRIRGELEPALAAAEAQAEILRVVPLDPAGQRPILDLVLLGMGEDGHVASLFPGEALGMAGSAAIYRAVFAPKPPSRRVTLCLPALAAARQVWVLITGPGKEAALAESLSPTGQTPLAQLVKSRNRTRIYSDIRLPAG